MNKIGKDAFHLRRIYIFDIKECQYWYKLLDAKLEGTRDHVPVEKTKQH